MRIQVFAVSLVWFGCTLVSAADRQPERGTVRYQPPAHDDRVADRFRLDPHEFAYELVWQGSASNRVRVAVVTFPSPVETPHANNNTVHCEYFRPRGDGPFPGVIVLHILGGDFELSRLCAKTLTLSGVSALFVKMPYYGPRQQPGVEREMISEDPHETVEGMTQAVLDIRRAAAWLGARPEVDPEELGIMGISLGGITAALATTAEPRFGKAFLMLAGGDVARIGWESTEVAAVRERWLAEGGSFESLVEVLRPVDPVQYADNARDRKIVMFNALHDKVVPPACTESLWHALGEPEIIWWDAGHYTAARYFPQALVRLSEFFLADE